MSKDRPWLKDSGIAIVGPGRLGQALGKLLAQNGFAVRWVVARRLSAARQAACFIRRGRALTLPADDNLMKARVVLLTVSDAALPEVVHHLAGLARRHGNFSPRAPQTDSSWRGKVVLHTCGSVSSAVLQALKRRGAAIGSLHPFQTVPNPDAGVLNLRACCWGVEGDVEARRLMASWVKAFGGVTFRVHPKRKATYHLAAFLVCPTVVTLMDSSRRLLRRAGVPDGVARPMLARFVSETAHNFVEMGARRALTGPAARGDWPTIRRHLAVLRKHSPETLPLYRALLQPMLRLAGQRMPQALKGTI